MRPSAEYLALQKLAESKGETPIVRPGAMFKCRMGVMLVLSKSKNGRGVKGHKWCYLTFISRGNVRRFSPSLSVNADTFKNVGGSSIEYWLERSDSDLKYIGNLFDCLPPECYRE